jgi:hypothetical protein
MNSKHLFVMLAAGTCLSCASSTRQSPPRTTETVRISGGAGATPHAAGGTAELSITPSTEAHTRTFAFPLDRVWGVLPAAYDSLGIPVTRLDPKDHVIGNPGFVVRRRLGKTHLGRYLDCGSTQGAPSVDSYDVNLSVISQAYSDAAGSTIVSTIVDARAKPVFASAEWSRCTSTGRLEAAILDGVKSRLHP